MTNNSKKIRGVHWTDKTGQDHPASKSIIQFEKDGSRVRGWETIEAAADFYHLNKGNISKACRGGRISCGGFRWEFKFPELQKCYQYGRDGLLVRGHNTILKASERTGFKTERIIRCCEGKVDNLAGNTFRFLKKRF